MFWILRPSCRDGNATNASNATNHVDGEKRVCLGEIFMAIQWQPRSEFSLHRSCTRLDLTDILYIVCIFFRCFSVLQMYATLLRMPDMQDQDRFNLGVVHGSQIEAHTAETCKRFHISYELSRESRISETYCIIIFPPVGHKYVLNQYNTNAKLESISL